jgi:hypothetical protein
MNACGPFLFFEKPVSSIGYGVFVNVAKYIAGYAGSS